MKSLFPLSCIGAPAIDAVNKLVSLANYAFKDRAFHYVDTVIAQELQSAGRLAGPQVTAVYYVTMLFECDEQQDMVDFLQAAKDDPILKDVISQSRL